MSGSRHLIEAFGDWQCCEEAPDGTAAPGLHGSSAVQEFNRAMLGRTIEAEVIPRLMLVHRGAGISDTANSSPNQRVTTEDIVELARIVIEHDPEVAGCYVDALRNQGVPIEAIFVELLAPTAHLLGEMWRSDQCSFTDVTVGMARLQQIVHELSPEFERESSQAFEGRRILLTTLPKEQHTLGLMIVEEYFRRFGWYCASMAPADIREVACATRVQHFDVVGISVSWGALLESTASAIQAIRKSSVNKSVIVLVGGGIFLENPQLVSRVGADGMAETGRQAVLQLRHLLSAKVKTL